MWSYWATPCSLTSNYWTDAVSVWYSTFWLLFAQHIKGRQQSTDRKQWPRTAEETYHQRRTYKQQTQQDRDALAEAVKVARTCNAFTFTAHCRSRSRSRSRRLTVFMMMMLCVVRPWAMVGCFFVAPVLRCVQRRKNSKMRVQLPYGSTYTVWSYVVCSKNAGIVREVRSRTVRIYNMLTYVVTQ